MNRTLSIRRAAVGALGVAAVGIGAPNAGAGILISFTDMNVVYDGSSLRDAGSPLGGFADPALADPVTSLDFFVDGAPVGTLSSNIAVDFIIPDVTNIPYVPNSAQNIQTSGDIPGIFDMLIGTSPAATEFLLLRLEGVNLTFLDVGGQAQFLFSGAIASIDGQDLPFGLEILEPIQVSFSVQVDMNTLTTSDGVITGFRATGTGEIAGGIVPSPASAAILWLCAATIAAKRRRECV